jgi:hypothetical protein
MRTTLTIDDDNGVRLERLCKERDLSLKELVNDAIRRGLDALVQPSGPRKPFRTTTFDGGEPLFKSTKELKELIAQLDEEEQLRKLGRS